MSRPRKPDELLIAALIQGRTHAEAARLAGVSERTVRRRLRDADVAARIQHGRDELTSAAAARMAELYPRAIETLGELLDDKAKDIRLRAAQSVLKIGPDFRARTEIEDRLRALEADAQTSS